MLNYTVTIAISAIFVPHYLAKFWPGGHLGTHPNDIYGGAIVVLLLVALNIVGVKEAAGLNIFLALADLGTQALLVVIGVFTVLSPSVLQSNVHLGVSPTWHDFIISIPVAMVAYTGIETISNMAEEAIDPPRHVPRSIMYVVLAVFAIYAFLPSVALSAMPVHPATAQDVANVQKYQSPQTGLKQGDPTSDLAGRNAGDPVAGVVEHLGLPDTITNGLGFYVAILAATILIIATNAGIIGVSRLTYSMGQHRQLPEIIRRIHPKYDTPYVAIVVYSIIAVLLMVPNGAIGFLGNLYAFGAMLSFTLAHASVIWMRRTMSSDDMPWRGPTSFHLRGYDVPTFAIVGGLGTLASWLVTVFLHFTDYVAPVGLVWLAIGMVLYYGYRRSQNLPLSQTVLAAQAVHGPAIEVEYRSILLPISSDSVDDMMTATALQLAAESGTSLVVLYPIEVPLSESLSAVMERETEEAERQLREAAALGREYGVNVITRIVRTRNIGQAIVQEAERRRSEIIVLGARDRNKPGERLFGRRIDYVLRNAHCRVMVGAEPVVR
jgi:APA family basic amino acid/polyamine antiporter